jgi:hypothetical protein
MYLDDAVTTITHFDPPIAWMYLDENGNVCVGTHHKIADAQTAADLPFSRWTAALATSDEIIHEFERVRMMRGGFMPSSYRRSDSLLLSKGASTKLLRDTLVSCAVVLSALFPDFDQYPDSVKIALLDMCYDVGVQHFDEKFCEAVSKQNWALASTCCRRDDVASERNHWTRRQFVDVAVAV